MSSRQHMLKQRETRYCKDQKLNLSKDQEHHKEKLFSKNVGHLYENRDSRMHVFKYIQEEVKNQSFLFPFFKKIKSLNTFSSFLIIVCFISSYVYKYPHIFINKCSTHAQ